MILRFQKPKVQASVAMQRAGYVPFRDPNTGEQSYVRRLGTYYYPRFHAYVEQKTDELVVKFHLDQKKPSYGSFTKHSGEYDGPTVEAEGDRITQVLG